MNDTSNGPAGNGRSRSDLELRMSEIERRIGRLEDGLTVPGKRRNELEAEVGVLREAVADLSASNLDLHNQLIKLVSSCERILAGSGEKARNAGREGALWRSASLVRRAARRTVRGTIGAARRLAGSNPPGAPEALRLEIEPTNTPVGRAPRIALVVRTSDDPAEIEPSSDLDRQTETDLTLVVWNEETSTAVVHEPGAAPVVVAAPAGEAVAAAMTAGLVAEVALPLSKLHPTLFERCRWTVASEGLPLIVADLARGSNPGGRLEPVADWLARSTVGSVPPRPALTKVVGNGWRVIDRPASSVVGAGFGRGYVVGAGATGKLAHRVAPVDGVVAPYPSGDERPAVLVLASSRAAELTAWLLRTMADGFRCTVLLTGEVDGSPLVRALTELADRVYPISGFLEPEILPSLVADLVRAHRVRSVLRVGTGIDLPDFDEFRPVVIDLPLHGSEVADEADLVLALGGDIGDAAFEHGLETMTLVPGPAQAGTIPAAEELTGIRSAYGVSEQTRLVLAFCDLEPAHRPEDVTAVARRLRHLEDVSFLVVGQGSLAGSISDLAGYFELDRFSLAPPGHPLTDLVAVSDCVLSTAELDPWPVAVGAALALGRSVVATDIDGVRELAEAVDFDRCALCPPGDVDALAAAVIEALDTHRRPRATKKAWKAAAARSAAAAEVVRAALDRAPEGEPESR